MERMKLLLLFCAVCLSDGFNIDVNNLTTFSEKKEDFFGYRVLQFGSDTHKQIIVSSPLRLNQSGAIYSCTLNKAKCDLIYQQDLQNVHFFGMSIAGRSTTPPGLTSCSPSLAQECDGNSYLNSICYHFNSSMKTVANSTVAFQECTKGVVNLVFLFDGSGSMTNDEFTMNKVFIWNIITQLKNSSIQFAAVQFSTEIKTVFTFNDYKDGLAEKKLDKETHMQKLTNTHRAIDYVLKNVFNNKNAGADPDAKKALVIITDGQPSDNDSWNVTKRCDQEHITRFVIGVKDVTLSKLETFASEPKKENTFKIENYRGLEGLLDKMQKKIYNIEGDQSGGSRFRKKELSQSGFSAVYNEDELILGAVGSNDWSGLLYEVMGSGDAAGEMEIKDPSLKEDSYMGYSVDVGKRGKVSLLISGAPRSNHRGQVSLFKKQNHKWNITDKVSGEQIGSYFGASLCLLDVNSDGDTDFVVVGAPLYYQTQPRREGRISIYSLADKMVKVMDVADSVQGQFAASVAPLADLNGDQLQDLAVGAPLEDEGKGTVYIYLGNQSSGIRPQYSQRILARMISAELQQFGVAISGLMDMEGDGLSNIVVGARGTVILFNARPVLSVSAQLTFSPSEISLDNFDCLITSEDVLSVVTLSTCFSMEENTNSSGAVNSGLNVSFELNADAVRQGSRAYFQPNDKKSRSVLMSVVLDSHLSCFNHTVYMPKCVEDTLSPVLIRLNFSQAENQSSSSDAVLNIDSKTMTSVAVPFQRNCENITCVADLELDFNYMNSTLLVVDQSYFIISVSLLNKGDDSFNTSVVLHYPPGLSLSKFETIKASRRTLSSCGDRDDGALDKTTCSISLPVYRKDTKATFQGTFRISRFYDWNDTMEMTLVASSDNNGNFTDGRVKKSLPVQFGVDVAISSVLEHSVIYLNFSLEDKGPKPVIITYMVRNQGVKGLPVSVNFMIPSQIRQNFILQDHAVSQNMTNCNTTKEMNVTMCPNQMSCVKSECSLFFLESNSEIQFEVKALAKFLNPQRYTGTWLFHEFSLEDSFSTSSQLFFDSKLYKQTSNNPKDDATKYHQAEVSVRAELIIPPNMYLIVCTGGGGGLLLLIIIILLLWKCGFFKRKHHYENCPTGENGEEKMEGENEENGETTTPGPEGGAESKGEEKRKGGDKENGEKTGLASEGRS